ncbi:MAG: hypothetical protein K0S74_1780 [Chlamydiales bacterium]|nr:hypothetical protein [Chlamydiales bacterium]
MDNQNNFNYFFTVNACSEHDVKSNRDISFDSTQSLSEEKIKKALQVATEFYNKFSNKIGSEIDIDLSSSPELNFDRLKVSGSTDEVKIIQKIQKLAKEGIFLKLEGLHYSKPADMKTITTQQLSISDHNSQNMQVREKSTTLIEYESSNQSLGSYYIRYGLERTLEVVKDPLFDPNAVDKYKQPLILSILLDLDIPLEIKQQIILHPKLKLDAINKYGEQLILSILSESDVPLEIKQQIILHPKLKLDATGKYGNSLVLSIFLDSNIPLELKQQVLLHPQFDPNGIEQYGIPIIHELLENNFPIEEEILKLISNFKIDPNLKNRFGKSLVLELWQRKFPIEAVLKLISDSRFDPNQQDRFEEPIVFGLSRNNLPREVILKLISNPNFDPNQKDKLGKPIVYELLQNNFPTKVIQELISNPNFDPNQQDKSKEPIVFELLRKKFPIEGIIGLMSNAQFDPNQKDKSKVPIVFKLVHRGFLVEGIRTLIKHPKFDPNQENRTGLPLIIELFQREAPIEEIITLISDPRFNPYLEFNGTPVVLYLLKEKIPLKELSKLISDSRFNPNQNDRYGDPIIFELLQQSASSESILSIVLHPHFDPNQKDKYGDPVIFELLQQNASQEAILSTILHPDFDPNLKTTSGEILPSVIMKLGNLDYLNAVLNQPKLKFDLWQDNKSLWSLLKESYPELLKQKVSTTKNFSLIKQVLEKELLVEEPTSEFNLTNEQIKIYLQNLIEAPSTEELTEVKKVEEYLNFQDDKTLNTEIPHKLSQLSLAQHKHKIAREKLVLLRDLNFSNPEDKEQITRLVNLEIKRIDEVMRNLGTCQKRLNTKLKEILLQKENISLAIPDTFFCSINRFIMKQPVAEIDGSIKHYYENSSIEQWLENNNTSPMTRKPLAIEDLKVDDELRLQIAQWKYEHNQKISNLVQSCEEEQQLLKLEIYRLNKEMADQALRRQEIQKISDKYEALNSQKIELANLSNDNPVITLSSRTVLSEGTLLYHCTTDEAVLSILEQGILKGIPHNFKDPELGEGLYLSADEPAYLDDKRHNVIVFKLDSELEGRFSDGVETYKKQQDQFGDWIERQDVSFDDFLTAGYQQLQNSIPFLRQAGLPPKDSEVLLQNPADCVRIVGIARKASLNENQQITSHIIPLEQYIEGEKIKLHSSWKPIETVSEFSDHYQLKDSNHATFFFKEPRENDVENSSKELALQAEVGGSQLAHRILGNLVPDAKLGCFQGKRGIQQPYIELKPLTTNLDANFDFNELSQKQQEQLFAHMMVDWIISNQDNHIKQFGLDKDANLMAIDKGQAYKFFKGKRVVSAMASQNIGNEANSEEAIPKFDKIKVEGELSLYGMLRAALKEGDIHINLEAPIIQNTLKNIQNLTLQEIQENLEGYAALAYPLQMQDFYQDVLERAQALPSQLKDLFSNS